MREPDEDTLPPPLPLPEWLRTDRGALLGTGHALKEKKILRFKGGFK
jgi:hypothetical protein